MKTPWGIQNKFYPYELSSKIGIYLITRSSSEGALTSLDKEIISMTAPLFLPLLTVLLLLAALAD